MTTVRCWALLLLLRPRWRLRSPFRRSAQVKWTLPSAYPADNFHSENLEAFAKDLAEATARQAAIKVYPNASLFPAPAIKSAVRIGQAQWARS
jgi:TRAP-type C4-dicarboxylate transport system substrate-binding protein